MNYDHPQFLQCGHKENRDTSPNSSKNYGKVPLGLMMPRTISTVRYKDTLYCKV